MNLSGKRFPLFRSVAREFDHNGRDDSRKSVLVPGRISGLTRHMQASAQNVNFAANWNARGPPDPKTPPAPLAGLPNADARLGLF